MSNAYERRVSAAIGYLDPGTRLRDNLIRGEAALSTPHEGDDTEGAELITAALNRDPPRDPGDAIDFELRVALLLI